MTVYLPYIGVTLCQRAKALLEEYPQNVVGSFWIMCGYGFETENIPDWWIDIVLKENQAQAIIDAFEQGYIQPEHSDPLYLGFCILIISDRDNPANLSYMIQHLRMWEFEGIDLLRIMAKEKIPAITEVSYPESFLNYRYGYNPNDSNYKHLRKGLKHWSVQVWEDYCSYLMAEHGQYMLLDYYRKVNLCKDQVKTTIEKSSKPLVLTGGETDPIYIKTALELLGERNILEQVDIEWVGFSIKKGKSLNSGDGGLQKTRDVLISNPKFLNKKVLILYDCDAKNVNDEDHKNLKIRKIPQLPDRKVQKGLENLFPDHLFIPKFYLIKTKYGDYGEKNEIQEFQKMAFCKWICEERKQSEDFKDFKIIINFIKDCLGTFVF